MKQFDLAKIEELNMTEQELDHLLSSEGSLKIRQAVQAVQEEHVSLAWRSQLNERLVGTIEAKQRKRRFRWILSPALGLGFAGALAVALFIKSPTTPHSASLNTGPQLEESLIASHQDSLRYSDVTGVGLNTDEVVTKRSPSTYDYNQFDFGSL